MRILLVGGTGLLGKAVHTALARRHHVVITPRGTADLSREPLPPTYILPPQQPVRPLTASNSSK